MHVVNVKPVYHQHASIVIVSMLAWRCELISLIQMSQRGALSEMFSLVNATSSLATPLNIRDVKDCTMKF